MAINALKTSGLGEKGGNPLDIIEKFNAAHSLEPMVAKKVQAALVETSEPRLNKDKDSLLQKARQELASEARVNAEKIGSGVGRMYSIVSGIVGESMNVVQNFIKITQGKPTISRSINTAKLSLRRAGEGSSRQLEKALQVVFPGTKIREVPQLIQDLRRKGIDKYREQIKFLEDILRRSSGSPTPVAA